MRHKQVPHNSLKSFRVRCDSIPMNDWNEHAGIGHSGRIAPIPTNNADNAGARGLRIINRGYDVRANVLLETPPADGKHQKSIAGIEPAHLQPGCKHRRPAFVVDSSRQFRNIVGWSVSLNPRDLSKIVHRVGCIGGATAYAYYK